MILLLALVGALALRARRPFNGSDDFSLRLSDGGFLEYACQSAAQSCSDPVSDTHPHPRTSRSLRLTLGMFTSDAVFSRLVSFSESSLEVFFANGSEAFAAKVVEAATIVRRG